MIKGNKGSYTKEEVLSHVSEYDIYRYYLGEFKLSRSLCNPLRGEETPSMIVRYRNGKLSHFDYGDPYYRGDCFDLVQQKYRCNYNKALLYVLKDLGVIEGPIKQEEVITWRQPPMIEDKVETAPFIQVSARRPTKEELTYWGKLNLTIKDLKEGNVYFPKSIYRNRKKLAMREGELTFCYHYPEIEKWKIYRPFAPKRVKETPPERWKWDSNVPFDYIEGLGEIHDCERSFMVKSRKDKLFFRKLLGTNCVYDVQAENSFCIREEDIKHIMKNSPVRYIIGDSDKPGKKFSWWLTNNYQFKHINVPDKYLPIKDFTDVAWEYGVERVVEYFQQKGII